MNVNSFGGGFWRASKPARFGDGLIDLFRQHCYIGNVLRRGRVYDTEKHPSATFFLPAQLPGVHCQIDGEARFLFHPQQRDAKLEFTRVMQIPVVLGPETQELPGYPANPSTSLFHPSASLYPTPQFRAGLDFHSPRAVSDGRLSMGRYSGTGGLASWCLGTGCVR